METAKAAPSSVAASNIFLSCLAVCAVTWLPPGMPVDVRSSGSKFSGSRGRCLLTTTHTESGSSTECSDRLIPAGDATGAGSAWGSLSPSLSRRR